MIETLFALMSVTQWVIVCFFSLFITDADMVF